MQLNTYLFFDGNCKAAFQYYERQLGGNIEMMLTGADAPEGMAGEMQPDKIMHVRMTLGNNVLMGSDALPNRFSKPQGFSVSLQLGDPVEAERIFNALAEDGTVHMPLEETFWAKRFGTLVDRFGIPWMVNCEKSS